MSEDSGEGPLLLDTHIFFWLASGADAIRADNLDLLKRLEAERGHVISAITPWEISMLVSKGKLPMEWDLQQWIEEVLSFPGLSLIDKMMLITRTPAVANIREFISQVIVEPVCDFLSKLLVSGSKGQLHATSPSSN